MYARSTTGAGFTVVETLIFLAISGLMFILAINAMSGKQQQTEFTTAINSLKSELNQDLSNVANGNYLALNNAGCTVSSSGAPQFIAPPAPAIPDGTCTVIGEVLDFTDVAGANGQESYKIFPVIGLNYTSTGAIVTDITNAKPHLNTSYNQMVSMPFGLNISTNGLQSSGNYGAFGLFNFTSFEGGASSSNNGQSLNSGSEHVEIFAIPGSTIGAGLSTINGLSNCPSNPNEVCLSTYTPTPINPMSGITFCVNSGTTSNQSATFTVGGANSPSSVNNQINSSGCP